MSTSPFYSRAPYGADLCKPWACYHSLCLISTSALLCLEGLIRFVFSVLSGSYTFTTNRLQGSLNSEERDLKEISHLGLRVPRLLHSAYCLVVGLRVCSNLLQKEGSLMMAEQGTLSDEYSRMSLGVVLIAMFL